MARFGSRIATMVVAVALVPALACGGEGTPSDAGGGEGDAGSAGPGSGAESGTDESEGGGGSPRPDWDPESCTSTDDCRAGACVALWDEATAELRRPFECVELCVEVDDPARICADDAACCDQASCDELGLCREAGDGTGDESSG